jgi:very-short-patch-repair endonuclease
MLRRMGTGESPDVVLGVVARNRAGIFTRAEAIAAGVSVGEIRRRVRTGIWVAEARGVLRASTTPDTIDARERAAIARAGDGAALSHWSAARRWRLGVPPPAQVWLTVPYPRHPRLPPGVRLTRSRHLPASAVRRVDGVPVVDPARTVVDLARHLDERRLTALALEAMQRELCTHDQIEAWRVLLGRRQGMASIAVVLREADPRFESILAAEFGRLTTNAGVVLVPQFRLSVAGGDVICDFADPVARIDFEADGFAYHSTPRQVAADKARDRRLLRVGWITVRYDTNDIRRRPTDTLTDVVRQIALRRPVA